MVMSSFDRRRACVLRLVLAICAVAVLAACSGVTTGVASSDPPPTGLVRAMGSVPGRGPAASYFEYGDLARERQLGVLDPRGLSNSSERLFDPDWTTVVGLGASDLASYAPPLAQDIGLDVYQATDALTIGAPPTTLTRLDGSFDASAITSKLTAFGAVPRTFDGQKGLSFGPDRAIDTTSKLARQLQGFQPLGQILVTGTQFDNSRDSATLEQQRDVSGDRSLLATGSYRDVADCLGDVVAAVILTPTHDDRSQVVAIGVRDPSSRSATQHEVLCIVPARGQQGAVHRSAASTLAPSATDPVTAMRVSQSVSATKVTDDGKLVRADVTDRNGGRVGYLLQGITRRTFMFWDGSCTPAALVRRIC